MVNLEKMQRDIEQMKDVLHYYNPNDYYDGYDTFYQMSRLKEDLSNKTSKIKLLKIDSRFVLFHLIILYIICFLLLIKNFS